MRRIINSKPLKLCFRGYAWYLYGFCTLRNDYRFFKLSRIMELEDTGEIFSPIPVGRVLEESYEQSKENIHVRMQVYQGQLYRVLEELPQGEMLSDGSMITEFDTNDAGATVNYILSMGAEAKVLEPEWLKEELTAQIEKMRNVYK